MITSLQTHVQIHTRENPNQCELCDKASATKPNWTRHRLCPQSPCKKNFNCKNQFEEIKVTLTDIWLPTLV